MQAVAVALVLVAVAAAASTSSSVAKGAFLTWQRWDPYDQPDDPVGVSYVWNSHYRGIHFPKKKTTVLKIKTEGPKRNLYWRATTLDDYTGTGWQESLDLNTEARSNQIDADTAALLPPVAGSESSWIKQDVTVEALKDNHLIASAQPMRWSPPSDATFQDESGDIVVLTRSLQRDQSYTVWSYAPQPTPKELGRAGTDYPAAIERYLEVIQTAAVPKFGTPNRDLLMTVFFNARFDGDPLMQANRPLYDVAKQVVEGAANPYAAAAALEAWFRDPSLGGFIYDEQPPVPAANEPALVQFVTETKRGYCQHFAGAMALMLRYLGIPARVAAGFTSGSYDADSHEWTVTDHEAHDWVEVYFPGWGWIPFDPTPGRGTLDARYSSTSPEFSGAEFNALVGEGGRGNPTFNALIRKEARPGLEDIGNRKLARCRRRRRRPRQGPEHRRPRAPRPRGGCAGRRPSEDDSPQPSLRGTRPTRPGGCLQTGSHGVSGGSGGRGSAERDARRPRAARRALLRSRCGPVRPRGNRRPVRAARRESIRACPGTPGAPRAFGATCETGSP